MTKPVPDEIERDLIAARREVIVATAGLHAFTIELGDRIAKKLGYSGFDGMDAIVLYLVNKHHWLPADIRAMSQDDLRLVLHDEFKQFPAKPRRVKSP